MTVPTAATIARLVGALPLAASAVAAAVGIGALFSNGIDAASVPALMLLALSLLPGILHRRATGGTTDRMAVLLTGFCVAGAVILAVIPTWIYGWNVNGVIHHSVVSVPLLLILSPAVAGSSIRALSGSAPSGRDVSLYPWLLLPIVLAFIAYGLLLGNIVVSGISGMKLDLLTTAYQTIPASKGGVAISIGPVGLLNNILGTFLLTALTLFLALLPGVGAGVFMSEYPGRLASAIDFCTQMLRAVSMFVIGAAAFGIVKLMNTWDPGSLLSQFVRGSYTDPVSGFASPDRGSFLLAAAVLALLVMPIIAKLTEEGLRSVPQDIREGSIALGAVEGHGLRRILLPWAAPNIVTALVLAAAEANGSLAAIVFLEGVGERGVGLTSGVTTLDYVVFASKYGPTLYAHTMDGYRLTAALVLLVLTLGLTVLAMALQRRFARRYRGSITSN